MADARQSAEWRLLERAWKDQEFREQLLRDPKGAVRHELGIELPPGLEIEVVEETAQKLVLVVPHRRDAAPPHALSASELENVAGGWEISGNTCSCDCQRCTAKDGAPSPGAGWGTTWG